MVYGHRCRNCRFVTRRFDCCNCGIDCEVKRFNEWFETNKGCTCYCATFCTAGCNKAVAYEIVARYVQGRYYRVRNKTILLYVRCLYSRF